MDLSYNPPDPSLADIMRDLLDETDEDLGEDPAQSAAQFLHEQLLLHGHRHSLTADSEQRQVVLKMSTDTARTLALLLAADFRNRK